MTSLLTPRRFLRVLLAALAAAWVAAACASPKSDVGSNTSWSSCRTTSDCSSGKVCVGGRCVPGDAGVSAEAADTGTSLVVPTCTVGSPPPIPPCADTMCAAPDWATACTNHSGDYLYQCGAYDAVLRPGIDTANWFFYDASGKLVGHVFFSIFGLEPCNAYDPSFLPPRADVSTHGFPADCVAYTGGCPSPVGSDAGPACAAAPKISDGVVLAQIKQPVGASLTGKVTALVPLRGPPCTGQYYGASSPGYSGISSRSSGSAFGFVLDSGVRVVLVTPFPKPMVHIGQSVQVTKGQGLACGETALWSGPFTLRDDSNQLIAWLSWTPWIQHVMSTSSTGSISVSSSASPSYLGTPPSEVSVEAGAPGCWYDDGCATQNFDDVNVGIGASSFTFTGGGTAQIGNYVVTYNGGPSSVTDVRDCPAYVGPATSIGVVRGDLVTLEATPTCGGKQCASTEYCDIQIASGCFSSDTAGTCKPRPTSCPTECDPVVACDGGFYCNECEAQLAGFSATDEMPCAFTGSWSHNGDSQTGYSDRFDCSDLTPSVAPPQAPSYERRCSVGADAGGGCECLHNGTVIGTAGTAGPSLDEIVAQCHFPSWLLLAQHPGQQ